MYVLALLCLVIFALDLQAQSSLNPPANFEVQAETPLKMKFYWDDNSATEDGFQIQRKKLGIYWNFTKTRANACYATEEITSFANEIEEFRIKAFSGKWPNKRESAPSYFTLNNPLPDLQLKNVSISPSWGIVAGSNLTVTFKVKNEGTVTSLNGSKITIYLTDNNDNISDGIELDESLIGALSPGQITSLITKTITIPITTSNGNYFVAIAVNHRNISSDLEVEFKKIAITEPNPDLTVNIMSINDQDGDYTINVGDGLKFSVVVSSISPNLPSEYSDIEIKVNDIFGNNLYEKLHENKIPPNTSIKNIDFAINKDDITFEALQSYDLIVKLNCDQYDEIFTNNTVSSNFTVWEEEDDEDNIGPGSGELQPGPLKSGSRNNNISKNGSLLLYPNPIQNELNIRNDANETYLVEVYSLENQLLKKN